MPTVLVNLLISKEELLRFYSGQAKVVVAKSESGQTIRFNAEHLRRFVQQDGIQGRFKIAYSNEGRFEKIEKLNE